MRSWKLEHKRTSVFVSHQLEGKGGGGGRGISVYIESFGCVFVILGLAIGLFVVDCFALG